MDEIVRKLSAATPAARTAAPNPAGSLDRHIRFRVTAGTSSGQKKSAEVWSEVGGQPAGSRWSIECDEGAHLGGADSAPPPLAYFSAAVAF